MYNSELRLKALAKVKDHNFSLVSAASFALAVIPLLMADVTGMPAADLGISFATGLVVGIAGAQGYARVAMGIWRQNKGGFRELFSGFTSLRRLKASLAPAAIYSAMLMLLRYFVLPGSWYAALAAMAGVAVLHTVLVYGCFGVEMQPDICPLRAFAGGVARAFRKFPSVLEMRLNCFWWIAAALGIALFFCLRAGLARILTVLIVFLVALVCRWMVGAFIALCEAGLAREMYKE